MVDHKVCEKRGEHQTLIESRFANDEVNEGKRYLPSMQPQHRAPTDPIYNKVATNKLSSPEI